MLSCDMAIFDYIKDLVFFHVFLITKEKGKDDG